MSTATSPLADYIDSLTDECDVELPLVHTTECGHIRTIGQGGKLEPRDCPVFHRPLLYFFYGRPAYRNQKAWSENAGPDLCPICFVIKPQRLESQIESIYPFDSGAASSGMFEPHINRQQLDHFKLTPLGKTLRRITKQFFNSNDHYFLGKANHTLNLSSVCQEASDYLSLVTHNDVVKYDDRRSAIEVTVKNSVDLNHTLMTVVIPLSLLEDPDLRQLILNDWGVQPITYNTIHGTLPGEYPSIIRQSLLNFFKGGYI